MAATKQPAEREHEPRAHVGDQHFSPSGGISWNR
jgi:hypothetical protein